MMQWCCNQSSQTAGFWHSAIRSLKATDALHTFRVCLIRELQVSAIEGATRCTHRQCVQTYVALCVLVSDACMESKGAT